MVYANISITAREFFLKHRYILGEKQRVIKNGVQFINFRAEKKFK